MGHVRTARDAQCNDRIDSNLSVLCANRRNACGEKPHTHPEGRRLGSLSAGQHTFSKVGGAIRLGLGLGLFSADAENAGKSELARAGVTGEDKKFPDGSKLAKIHWNAKKSTEPGLPIIPDTLHDVDFMVRDGKRFADSGAWGYAEFEYDAASATYRPGNMTDKPPQGNDAKCGFACHTVVANKDYVFTAYGKR
jgi:Cytochrome P460